MKRYKGVVIFTYYKEVEVEAEDKDQAHNLMYDAFERSNAYGESEIKDFREIKGEIVWK
jgi:hypothetical protein